MYPSITPPIGIPAIATEMTTRQAKQYFEWFRAIIPERMNLLEGEVCKSSAYSTWRTDYSPESLQPLAAWFAANVATEAIEPQPIAMRGMQVASVAYKLSGETYTRSFDAGIYFGETLIRSIPDAAWDIVSKGSKRNANYGHSVVRGRSSLPCNPGRLMVTFAHAVVGKIYGPERIQDLYVRWISLLSSTETTREPER